MSSSPSTQPSISAHATLTLAGSRLELRCTAANVREDRTLSADDEKKFEDWSARHLKLAKDHDPAALLKLGQEMGKWLDGASSSFTTIVETGTPPLVMECRIGKMDESLLARAFLDAPWELLSIPGHSQHCALHSGIVLTVIRRIGPVQNPPPVSVHRLGVVFMAAAPRGEAELGYEAEEATILTSTRDMGLDLVVEESGTLDLLDACVAREKPDVVQISCHGALRPTPGLCFETETGDEDFVTASRLEKVAQHHPRLLFLSACETAETHTVLDSLAQSLVRAGARALLGWAASVRDDEAALFASLLLGKLAQGKDLAEAFAFARRELADHPDLRKPHASSGSSGLSSEGWHLARLYFSPQGGGSFATAKGRHRLVGHGEAAKTFLDVKGSQVPVAGDLEFVGRRRQIQTILREFRAPSGQRQHAGVLIHGMGRQGKSSLAARVARRMEQTHEILVLFGRYDAQAILTAFNNRLGTPEVQKLVTDHLPLVEQNADMLQQALTALLQGPCKEFVTGQQNRPVLLIVDDFEQMLEAQTDGPHKIKTELAAQQIPQAIRALINAFRYAKTESCLLFTSRFEFTLPDAQGQDLGERLLPVPLPGMTRRESLKQISAKLRQQPLHSAKHAGNLPQLTARLDAITTAAQHNAGLQDLLFSLCLESPADCDTCLQELKQYSESGTAPTAEKLSKFLENLAIQGLLKLLAPPVRELLRASTLFQVPIPVAVMEALAKSPAIRTDTHAIARLLELGLWEPYEDLHDHRERALGVNALVRPLVDDLSEEEQRKHAAIVSVPLFECWGAEDEKESLRRGSIQDLELTRLALLAPEPRVVVGAAAGALRVLDNQFAYKAAAAWAQQVMVVLGPDSEVQPSVDLLRTAADAVERVGEVGLACEWRDRAFQLVQQGAAASDFDRGSLAIAHARSLVQRGRIDEALASFEEARQFAGNEESQAVVLGEVARIRAVKGEVDAALALHEKMLGRV